MIFKIYFSSIGKRLAIVCEEEPREAIRVRGHFRVVNSKKVSDSIRPGLNVHSLGNGRGWFREKPQKPHPVYNRENGRGWILERIKKLLLYITSKNDLGYVRAKMKNHLHRPLKGHFSKTSCTYPTLIFQVMYKSGSPHQTFPYTILNDFRIKSELPTEDY